jgi:outer membrane immunogenic protein
MRLVLLAATAAACCSAPAMAQDARFPGFHVEGMIGYDHTSARVTYEDTAFPADNFEVEEDTNGVVFGIGAGYDVRLSEGKYFGIEAGYEFSDNERCEEVYGGDEACFSLKRNLYVGARGGARLSARTLAFAGIGYINGKGRVSYADPADPTGDFSYTEDRDGFRLSAGLEHRLVRNIFGKIEYRYYNYDNFTEEAGTERASLGFDRNQLMIGLGARF